MPTRAHLDALEHSLLALGRLLQQYLPLINVCMVDFIQKNIFQEAIPPELQEDLSQLSDQEICSLPGHFVHGSCNSVAHGHLRQVLLTLHAHSLQQLGVLSTMKDLYDPTDSQQHSVFRHFDRIASDKKMHEVTLMNDLVAHMARVAAVDNVIDLGSGIGYLSHVLAATTHLRVLAIDSCDQNSSSAEKRADRLDRRWKGLVRRADLRATGQQVLTKGKHWKAKLQGCPTSEDSCETGNVKNQLRFATCFVNDSIQLDLLFQSHFSLPATASGCRMGMVGLHTCGNLASNSLKIFVNQESVRFCCNVGCCYHLLQDPDAFPLSSALKATGWQFGRNPLMLAAQPMGRLVNGQQLPSASLLWRAILQVLLVRHKADLTRQEQQVGRTAAKSADFLDYVRKSLQKLQLDLVIGDEEIQHTFHQLSELHGRKLNAFHQLRSLFAPLIEGLVLLDRLVYLLEQDIVAEAHLVQMFDPVVSPRCFALVATKIN